jgi:uncharacterized protein DUF6585
MLAVPVEAEALITLHQLGAPKKVYKPFTLSSIIGGLIVITFAFAWILAALFLTGSPLLPVNQLPFQISPIHQPIDPTLATTLTILGIVFPLFGLIFVGLGLAMIISALLNRHVRAVLCEYGVAHLGRKGADAFRWEQVATVLDQVSVHRRTTKQSDGNTNTSTTISHIYTVACKDGRRFIFNNILGKAEQLGQEIQIAVAMCQTSA